MGWKKGVILTAAYILFAYAPVYSQTTGEPVQEQRIVPPPQGAIEQPAAPVTSSPQKTEPQVIQTTPPSPKESAAPSPPPQGAIEQPAAPVTPIPRKTEQRVIQTTPPVPKEGAPPTKKSEIREITKEGDYITINFNNIELQAFTKFISDLTKKNFIIDDKVQGKVTIVSPTRISKEEAYQTFLSVLEVKGFTAVETDNVIKIIPSREVKQSGVKVISDKERDIRGEGFVTKIFHLNYVSPTELTKIITLLIFKD